MSKSPTQRVEYLEEIVIGAGFLLKKIYATLGHEFGAGMDEQMRQCIRECDEVGRVHLQRKAREE
jgi:hypothetical protein